MVQFYGVLTEPNFEFEFVGEKNDWFKIGKIETVKVCFDLQFFV